MVCFGALVFERITLKIDLNRNQSISMVISDLIYGLAGIVLLVSGILRVRYFGQGADFYTHNPIFWIKVGILSLSASYHYIQHLPIFFGQFP